MEAFPICSPVGVLATLAAICAFFFWLEKTTQWRMFRFLPPLIFIYLTPLALSNSGVLTAASPVYDAMQQLVLPMMLVLLLQNVDVRSVVQLMGRGMGVMLFGSLGVVLGAALGLIAAQHWLSENAWKAYGTLAASWIGGTGNMAAVAKMLGTDGTEFGLAILADSTIYVFWLPILLVSKRFADPFAHLTGARADALQSMRAAVASVAIDERTPTSRDYLFLLGGALATTWLADLTARYLPVIDPYLSTSTWQVLLVTSAGIALSFTPVRRVPGSQPLGMALVFLFVARMGATAELTGVAEQAMPFLLGAAVMILTHGAFCLLGAWLFRADIHSAAIASAANIGGAASASIVASFHEPALVPAAILMALVGYAVGNFAGYFTALLCRFVS